MFGTALKVILAAAVIGGLYVYAQTSGMLKAKAPQPVNEGVEAPIPEGSVRVYKWVDDNGVVNYGEKRLDVDSPVEHIDVDPNTNMVQSIKIDPKARAAEQSRGPIAKFVRDTPRVPRRKDGGKTGEQSAEGEAQTPDIQQLMEQLQSQ